MQKVQADLSDVKTAMNTTTLVADQAEKKVNYLEHPASIAYKGIRITPGGDLENTFLLSLPRDSVGSGDAVRAAFLLRDSLVEALSTPPSQAKTHVSAKSALPRATHASRCAPMLTPAPPS